jgi:hypothetical protein
MAREVGYLAMAAAQRNGNSFFALSRVGFIVERALETCADW